MLRVERIIEDAKCVSAGLPDGRYVAARPIQFNGTRPGNQPIWDRLRDAWQIVKGRADAVQWEGQ